MNRQREADADRRHRGRAVVAVAHQGAVGSGSASRIAAHDPVLDHRSTLSGMPGLLAIYNDELDLCLDGERQ
jgi:hypothetical protein